MGNYGRRRALCDILLCIGLTVYVLSESPEIEWGGDMASQMGIITITGGIMLASLAQALHVKPDIMARRMVVLGWSVAGMAALTLMTVFVPRGYFDLVPALVGVFVLGLVYAKSIEWIEPRDEYLDETEVAES